MWRSAHRRGWLTMLVFMGVVSAMSPAQARDAAFTDPGLAASAANANADAITVEPKSEIDTGESLVDIARRTTLFFVNRTGEAVEIVNVVANGDGNVKSEIVSDDCTTQGKIDPTSRCSIAIEVTPSTPGSWSVEVLMTHKGTGRIAKAKLTGKATGQTNVNKQDSGLSLSTKDVKPVDFGQLSANGSKAVRSALMLNDSVEPITIISIDVIAAENGLERLEQGCSQDMELKSGESCPVTMVWQPTVKGQISTDLIIRHTGRMGFTVIPLRGTAKEDLQEGGNKTGNVSGASGASASDASNKSPPTLSDADRVALDKIPPLAADLLPTRATTGTVSYGTLHLIGTVGNRAIFLKPDGSSAVAGIGEEIENAGQIIKLTNVMPKSVEIFIDGHKKQLSLEAVGSLTKKAAQEAQAAAQAAPSNSMDKK